MSVLSILIFDIKVLILNTLIRLLDIIRLQIVGDEIWIGFFVLFVLASLIISPQAPKFLHILMPNLINIRSF